MVNACRLQCFSLRCIGSHSGKLCALRLVDDGCNDVRQFHAVAAAVAQIDDAAIFQQLRRRAAVIWVASSLKE